MKGLCEKNDIEGLEERYRDNPVSGVSSSAVQAMGGECAVRSEIDHCNQRVTGTQPTLTPRLWLVFQEEGSGSVTLAGQDDILHAGDLALQVDGGAWKLPRPAPGQSGWGFVLGEPAAAHRDVLGRLPVVLPQANPATALVAGFGRNLASASPALSTTLRRQFLDQLLDMVGNTLASVPNGAGELPRLARFHLYRIKSYLSLHLREPDLSVKKMAADLGLSVSHVHRVFSHEGGTVADWFWSKRLEGCAADLGHAGHAHRTVGEIALSWGFNDLSHFSHAFRKRFQASPREWRNRSPWRQPLFACKT